LREWCAKAKASGIRQLQAMAGTLLRHAKGILSYYKTGLTSGKMEGINRKIRGLLASAFRFHDQDFPKLRLYALHEAKFKSNVSAKTEFSRLVLPAFSTKNDLRFFPERTAR
jgi:Transposase